MRKILLIEPNYKNKYPPLGLMKISTYHKKLGDTVVFFKGEEREYFRKEKFETCLNKVRDQGFEVDDWDYLKHLISEYLKNRSKSNMALILELVPFEFVNTISNILKHYAFEYQPEKKWDRVYITTLFTFHWKSIKKSIEFAKKIVKSLSGLFVGGVAASLITDIIAEETGLEIGKNIITGLLDKPGILDDNHFIIDEMIPDYGMLEISEYKYRLDTGFLTYMTKGCTRKCIFCAVPKLEPQYKEMISFKSKIKCIRNIYGDRKDLILMDNNVLGSPKFELIIEEILEMGFKKDAKFLEPNYLPLWINQLKSEKDINNRKSYKRLIGDYLMDFGVKRIRNQDEQDRYYQLIHDNKLESPDKINLDNLVNTLSEINFFIEKYRNKSLKSRYVDFNQGIDCRYINEENMKLLSKLPIRPMRIAFDYYSLRKQYETSIRLAAKYKIRELSNYVLYNYNDKPEDFWKRLKINIDLNEELEIKIFSFPMKYIPLNGKESLNRKFIGKHWNPKFHRAIQAILNVTKGIVMPGKSFFDKAYGATIEEFFEILIMPEQYILQRFESERNGRKTRWLNQYKNLNQSELKEAKQIIYSNCFNISGTKRSKSVVEFINDHYLFKY